jgi:hypothetical protein
MLLENFFNSIMLVNVSFPGGKAIALGVSLPEAWQTLRYRQRVKDI